MEIKCFLSLLTSKSNLLAFLEDSFFTSVYKLYRMPLFHSYIPFRHVTLPSHPFPVILLCVLFSLTLIPFFSSLSSTFMSFFFIVSTYLFSESGLSCISWWSPIPFVFLKVPWFCSFNWIPLHYVCIKYFLYLFIHW